MASKWSNAPCLHYCPTDDSDQECAMCGWDEQDHETPLKGNGKMTDKTLSYDQKLDILMDAVNMLTEVLEEITEQQAEIIEKLENVSTPGGNFGIYEEQG